MDEEQKHKEYKMWIMMVVNEWNGRLQPSWLSWKRYTNPCHEEEELKMTIILNCINSNNESQQIRCWCIKNTYWRIYSNMYSPKRHLKHWEKKPCPTLWQIQGWHGNPTWFQQIAMLTCFFPYINHFYQYLDPDQCSDLQFDGSVLISIQSSILFHNIAIQLSLLCFDYVN